MYYQVLLENLWTNERSHKRKVHQRDSNAYSAKVYQQGSQTLFYILQGLRRTQAAGFIYNVYGSILQDSAIDREHRIDLLHHIENKALQFWAIKHLKASTNKHDIPEKRLDEALGILWKTLELGSPLPFSQELLYAFLNPAPEKQQEGLLAIFQDYIRQQKNCMDWIKFRKYRDQIDLLLQKLKINNQDWDTPFVELANDLSLSAQERLCTLYFVLDGKSYRALQEAYFKDPHMNGTLEFFRAFLGLGYQENFVGFINASPPNLSLNSFDRFYQAKLHAMAALSEFYDYHIALWTELGYSLNDIAVYREAIETILQCKLAINTIYPLYKLILQKRACECQLETIIEAKKDKIATCLGLEYFQNKRIYMNHRAYVLPSVFDPEWKEGYEAITFEFFLEAVASAMQIKQQYHDLSASDTIERKDYLAVFKTWKEILTDPRHTVIKTLLNVQEADDNTYALKLTAVAAGIIEGFKKGSYEAAAYEEAEKLMNGLVFNTQTCEGGQLQAIDYAYGLLVKEAYQYVDAPQERALNIVHNCLYMIRKNWVMEDDVSYTEKGKMVKYSPHVADGVFINALTPYLDKEALRIAFECDEAELKKRTFLKNRNLKQDRYGRTHIGHGILGIAGIEIGLLAEGRAPIYDKNIDADSWFLKNTVSDKVSIVSAFVESFTFENIWQALADLIWKKAAEESSFGILVYKDPACTQTLNLDIYEDHEGIIARQDPLANGVLRFLNHLGLSPDACCEKMTIYYKDPLVDIEQGDYSSIQIYACFTKEGIAQILAKLNLLTVEP